MEEQIICLDSTILIDYFRQKDKTKSTFFELLKKYKLFAVSAVTEYEVLIGSNTEQDLFWNSLFERITVLPFDKETNKTAVKIFRQLKSKNKLIAIPDILIGATALAHKIPLATLNKKHFERIEGLNII